MQHFIVLLCVFALAPFAHAQKTTNSIANLKVEGNRKIETTAILEKISSKSGQPLDNEKIRQDIQSLFEMGYFEDVKAERDGNTVIFTVKEKPTISVIDYDGNEELEDSDLKDKIGIKPFELVNYAKIQNAINEIQKAYEDKGYLLARVDYELQPDKDSQQSEKLVFKISENEKVKVKRVTFMGAKKILPSELKGILMTQEGGYFSFLSGSGTYKQDAFDQDVRNISAYYFDKGYVQAKVSRPEVSVTPDKKGIFISIRVEEGELFQVGDVEFGGDLLFTKEELRESIKLDEKEDFSSGILQADLRALEAKYGDLGYAYANIIPRTQVLERERKVNVLYEIDKGQKVYFRKISVIGNASTRDKVVRRELRVGEGELYNETKRRESMANIRRLGFFDDVQFMTKTPSGRDDLMDIDIIVKERHTGAFQLGAGYASSLGAQLNVQLNENNFLGYGYKAGLQVEYNQRYKNFLVNFTDPYFRDTMWSLGSDIYYTNSQVNQYIQQNKGIALRAGHPILQERFDNRLYGYLKYKIDDTFVRFDPTQDFHDVLDPKTVNGTTSSVTTSVIYDHRDDRMMPSDGVYAEASYEFAGLGGDIHFMKANTNLRYYKKVFWDVVFRNNFAYGAVSALGDKPIPFTEYYRLGGPNNLRGFGFRAVGKRMLSTVYRDYLVSKGNTQAIADQLANVVVGGKQQMYYMTELEFPLAKEANMRGVIFYDIGQAEDNITASNFRSDFGFGIRWFSPMGPLRFEFGFPLDRRAEFQEKSNNFQFAVGSPF